MLMYRRDATAYLAHDLPESAGCQGSSEYSTLIEVTFMRAPQNGDAKAGAGDEVTPST